MLVFEDAIVISLRPVSVSFAMRLRSRPGLLHHRPARPWRDESIRIGLRTLILTLLGVLTIAAPPQDSREYAAVSLQLPGDAFDGCRRNDEHLATRSKDRHAERATRRIDC